MTLFQINFSYFMMKGDLFLINTCDKCLFIFIKMFVQDLFHLKHYFCNYPSSTLYILEEKEAYSCSLLFIQQKQTEM